MARAYATAGVVVCPSVVPEGLGLVALEAQAVGTPLVTSGRGGLSDATFSPNEVVAELEVEPWLSAIERAYERGVAPAARRAVEAAHRGGRARSSLAAVVAPILPGALPTPGPGPVDLARFGPGAEPAARV